MRLLIDGYNLLHATDLFGEGEQAGTLEGSREALIAFLTERLSDKERRQAVIVFDAAGAPPGLPDRYTVESLAVRFARGYPDADTLLEALIDDCRAPRSLIVVSSDHRVQRAARQRGAAYTDSDAWFRGVRGRGGGEQAESRRPDGDIGGADYWAEQFKDDALMDEAAAVDKRLRSLPPEPPPSTGSPHAATRRANRRRGGQPDKPARPKRPFGEGILDPFPPGYADDLAEGFDDASPGDADSADD